MTNQMATTIPIISMIGVTKQVSCDERSTPSDQGPAEQTQIDDVDGET